MNSKGEMNLKAECSCFPASDYAADPYRDLVASCSDKKIEVIMCLGQPTEKGKGRVGRSPYPGFGYEVKHENGLYIEKDVSILTRGGYKIYADIYRPDNEQREENFPVILLWGPYGKHDLPQRLIPEDGIDPTWISQYANFECPDPAYWCKHGYAIVSVDSTGFWSSEGDFTFMTRQEAEDCCDVIEWLGTRNWCNGKVGMAGISYYAMIQWRVASLRPKHLAAINPWEGLLDIYRESFYHGGIPESFFVERWGKMNNFSNNRLEDQYANARAHPLIDCYYAAKQPDVAQIEVPAYIVASWSDQGLHTRGTLEAFKRIGSRQKWLEVHGRKKWSYFYQPDEVEKQRQFFDHFLKGTDDTVLGWPKVSIEVREKYYVGEVRAEDEWPISRTKYEKLFLDASTDILTTFHPDRENAVRYNSEDTKQNAHFDYLFPETTEITGHMKLRLWVSTSDADDMDIFVAIQKVDQNGNLVPFAFFSLYEDGPVALGWLRVSHRELDERLSTPYQPVHLHRRELKLTPDVPVPIDIEIWPSGTKFKKGERLRVLISGKDIYTDYPPMLPRTTHADLNRGMHVIHTGGKYDSHLLVPVIPPKKA